jgi:hypothetical protein
LGIFFNFHRRRSEMSGRVPSRHAPGSISRGDGGLAAAVGDAMAGAGRRIDDDRMGIALDTADPEGVAQRAEGIEGGGGPGEAFEVSRATETATKSELAIAVARV